MTEEALHQLWNTYQRAWSDIPAEERRRLLQASLAPDIAFTSPDSDEHGIERMIATLEDFQVQYAGCYFKTTLQRHQHGQFLCAWTLFDRDERPLVNGHSYGRLNEEQGRITYLAGFWKL